MDHFKYGKVISTALLMLSLTACNMNNNADEAGNGQNRDTARINQYDDQGNARIRRDDRIGILGHGDDQNRAYYNTDVNDRTARGIYGTDVGRGYDRADRGNDETNGYRTRGIYGSGLTRSNTYGMGDRTGFGTGDTRNNDAQNNDNNRDNRNNGTAGIFGNNSAPSYEIQQMNNGFITIDQNSYSTSTPSKKFPHVRHIRDGRIVYYKFDFGRQDTNQGAQPAQPRQAQPNQNQGAQPGQAQPNQNQGAQPRQEAQPNQNQGTQQPGTTPAPQQAEKPKSVPTNQQGAGLSDFETKVIELTNVERRKNGLQDLKADPLLSNVAQEKSNDMQAKNYFSHTSPTYGSPFDMMRDFGVTYKTAGENIAMGQTTPQQVVQAWMNSEGHRKNILSANYTHIGVGHTETGHYWTQMFIGK